MHHEPIRHHVVRKKADQGITLKRTFWTGLVDVAIYPVGALSLVFTIPQVYEVWVLGKVEGISLITWSMWAVSSLFWLAYGLMHRAMAVAFMQIGWLIIYALVIAGVLLKT